jgi:hypothetical protein
MDKDVMVESHQDVTSERVYGAVKKWLDARPAKPFFLFAHFFDVHFDFTPPPPYDKKFDPTYEGWVDGKNFLFSDDYAKDMPSRDFQHLLALYDGEIAWTDSFIGRIRADLEKAGILEDTVIVITSDHGTEFFEHHDKGHRKTLWDEVIKTPLIIRYPKRLPSGKRSNELSRGIDVGPTLLELAGFPAPTDVFGTSLMPLVKNPGGHVIGRAHEAVEGENDGPVMRGDQPGGDGKILVAMTLARADGLGRHQHVRHDVPCFDAPEAAGAAAAGQRLVGDHQDAVFVADLADPGPVVGAGNRELHDRDRFAAGHSRAYHRLGPRTAQVRACLRASRRFAGVPGQGREPGRLNRPRCAPPNLRPHRCAASRKAPPRASARRAG